MNEDAGNGGTRLDAAKQAVGDARGPAAGRRAARPARVRLQGQRGLARRGLQGHRADRPGRPAGQGRAARHRQRARGQGPDADRPLAAGGARTTSAPRRAGAASSWSPTAATTARRPIPARRPRRWPSAASSCRSRSSASRSTTASDASCKCIAAAGGGSYVDVGDADQLGDELAALLSRAFRSYEPTGTAVEGAPDKAQAPALGQGCSWTRSRPRTRGALVHGRRARGPAAGRLGHGDPAAGLQWRGRVRPAPDSRRARNGGPRPSRPC